LGVANAYRHTVTDLPRHHEKEHFEHAGDDARGVDGEAQFVGRERGEPPARDGFPPHAVELHAAEVEVGVADGEDEDFAQSDVRGDQGRALHEADGTTGRESDAEQNMFSE